MVKFLVKVVVIVFLRKGKGRKKCDVQGRTQHHRQPSSTFSLLPPFSSSLVDLRAKRLQMASTYYRRPLCLTFCSKNVTEMGRIGRKRKDGKIKGSLKAVEVNDEQFTPSVAPEEQH